MTSLETLICYILIYIAEASIIWLYARRLFPLRFRTLPALLTLAVCYTALFGLHFFQLSWLNITAFLTGNFFFLLAACRTSPPAALIHAAVVTAAMSVGELISVACLFQIAYDFYTRQFSFRDLVVSSVFSKLIYFFILQLILCFLTRRKSSAKPLRSGNRHPRDLLPDLLFLHPDPDYYLRERQLFRFHGLDDYRECDSYAGSESADLRIF